MMVVHLCHPIVQFSCDFSADRVDSIAISGTRNTRAEPSLTSTPAPRTPVSRICHEDKNEQPSPGKCNLARQEKGYARRGSPRTPSMRRTNEMSPSKTQEPLNMRTPVAKSSVGAKTPSWINRISPTKSYFSSSSNKASPRRSLRASMFNTPDGGAVIDKRLACSPSISSSQGRAPASISESGKRLSSTRVKVGSQIEALYRAKSLERQAETSHKIDYNQVLITPTKPQRGKAGKGVISSPGITQARLLADISPSRVADMKKLFEKQVSTKQEMPRAKRSPTKPAVEQVNSIEREATVKPFQPPSPPPPPPLPDFSSRTSGISPRTLRETLLAPPTPVPATTTHVELPGSIIAQPLKPKHVEVKEQRMKSRLFGEKIKLFEDIAQRRAKLESRRKKRSFSGKYTIPSLNTRKSIFELSSRKNIKSSSRSLSAETIQEIVEDVQKDTFSSRFGKHKTQNGKCYALPQDAASDFSNISYLTARDDMQILLARTSDSIDMVVKEAQCGLREPKPMRLVEMKRMMLLCREKAGFPSSSSERRKDKVSGSSFSRLGDA
jgi:hypothetical protein